MQPPQERERAQVPPRDQPLLVDIADLVKVREQGGVAFELEVPRFDVAPGRFVALVGESGCGKSTLLDILALVLKPTRCGRFLFQNPDGESLWTSDDVMGLWDSGDERELALLRRHRLGYVLQSGGLLPFLSAWENLRLPLLLNGRQDRGAEVKRLAERIGVANVLAKKPRYLSGGQRQRVAILRALVHGPALILADEPTAAVDRARARSIVEDLAALAREGGSSVIMVTHDPQLVVTMADQVWGFEVEQVSENLTRSRCVRVQP
ncbi:MAG: ABC transporter ATP-binding protein [Chromatiales bacterium]|nr:ABC transporter ATP-binding protein [Chromatiales bacterium]